MRRPSTLLMVSVKVPDIKHRIFVPVPLVLAESAAFCGKMIHRFGWIRSPKANEVLKEIIPALPLLLRELRKAGPMTLVEVMEAPGTHVTIKLI